MIQSTPNFLQNGYRKQFHQRLYFQITAVYIIEIDIERNFETSLLWRVKTALCYSIIKNCWLKIKSILVHSYHCYHWNQDHYHHHHHYHDHYHHHHHYYHHHNHHHHHHHHYYHYYHYYQYYHDTPINQIYLTVHSLTHSVNHSFSYSFSYSFIHSCIHLLIQ